MTASTAAAPTRMFIEAGEAGAAVARQRIANADAVAAIAARLRAAPPRAVVTLARGSSDHAATYAKYLIETLAGVLVSSASPSVSSLYGPSPQIAGALCIAISQSGRSPDLLAGVAAAGAAGAATLALVNAADSPLAAACDMVLPLRAGPETSVAATKSYIASLAAIAGLVAAWTGDADLDAAVEALPGQLAAAAAADWSALGDALQAARGLYVIGRGYGLGIAQEAALKCKETCGLHAEAFSAAEVRHGPMALLGPDLPVLVFRQDDESAEGVDAFVEMAIARGSPVLVAGAAAPTGAIMLASAAAHPATAPIVQIQAFYRAVNALALRRGFDPDRPPHLSKVTRTL